MLFTKLNKLQFDMRGMTKGFMIFPQLITKILYKTQTRWMHSILNKTVRCDSIPRRKRALPSPMWNIFLLKCSKIYLSPWQSHCQKNSLLGKWNYIDVPLRRRTPAIITFLFMYYITNLELRSITQGINYN